MQEAYSEIQGMQWVHMQAEPVTSRVYNEEKKDGGRRRTGGPSVFPPAGSGHRERGADMFRLSPTNLVQQSAVICLNQCH